MSMSEVQLCGICKKPIKGKQSKIELFGQQYESHDSCNKLVMEYHKTEEYKSQFLTVNKYSTVQFSHHLEVLEERYWKLIREFVVRHPEILGDAMGDIKMGQAVSMSSEVQGKIVASENDPETKIIKDFKFRHLGISLQPYQKKFLEDTDSKIFVMPARGGTGLRGYSITRPIIIDEVVKSLTKKEKKKVNKRSKKIIRKGRFRDFETKIKANWDDPDYEMNKLNKVKK